MRRDPQPYPGSWGSPPLSLVPLFFSPIYLFPKQIRGLVVTSASSSAQGVPGQEEAGVPGSSAHPGQGTVWLLHGAGAGAGEQAEGSLQQWRGPAQGCFAGENSPSSSLLTTGCPSPAEPGASPGTGAGRCRGSGERVPELGPRSPSQRPQPDSPGDWTPPCPPHQGPHAARGPPPPRIKG